MPTNKHATIRYHALDQSFSNFGRKYFIEDLIEACNKAIYEYSGTEDGVKRRQIYDDILFMESDEGWSIPLERTKDGKKVYYRYQEKDFSIKKQAINKSEANQLNETLSILSRFKGMPHFEWMEEMLVRLDSTFQLQNQFNKPIVGFEQNPFLKGLDFFSELFSAIQYKRVLEISYQSFKQDKPHVMILHPYYLKQYNSRWFLFAYNDKAKSISNLALDRIIEIKERRIKYIENNEFDFEEYFEDVVGVTVKDGVLPEKIFLQIDKSMWPYIESKPIHGSQKIIEHNSSGTLIELNLQLNYEIISLLFSYGEQVNIIGPEKLKIIIKNKAKKVIENYS